MDIQAYLFSKKYTDDSVAGGGAIKGKNCVIDSKTQIEGGTRLTFKWTLDNGTVQTTSVDVMNGQNGQDGQDGQDGAQGQQGIQGEPGLGIKSVAVNAENHLIITYDDDTTDDAGQIVASGSSELTSAMTTTKSVGGISTGTNYAQGTKLEKIIRDMLAPVLYPSFTAPSASLSATGSKLIEKGGTLNTTFTATFNRGTINPAYGTSGYRSGAATGYKLNSETEQAGNTWSKTITESQLTYKATVYYAAGEQPKDSSGANYSSPLPAGNVETNTISYEFVEALWANTASIATVAKLALVSKTAKLKQFDFKAATAANPEIFDVPSSWTVTAVEVLNTLNNQWEDCSSEFTVTETTHNNAGGTAVNYDRYTCNLGYDMGARSVRIKWS